MTTQKVDIIFAGHSGHLRGGAEMSLLNLVTYVAKKGYKIAVILPEEGDIQTRLMGLGIQTFIVDEPYWAKGQDSDAKFDDNFFIRSEKTLTTMLKIIDDLQPNICISATIVIPWLCYAAALSNKTHAWMLHEFGVLDHGLNFMLGEKQTIKTIDILSDKIFVNSQATKRHFEKLFVVNNSLDVVYPYVPARLAKHKSDSFRDGALKLVIVGQIKPSKGQMDAVAAVKLLKDTGKNIQLAIVGREENVKYSQDIKEYVVKHDLADDVLFIGYSKSPESYVKAADIVLVCSTNEAFGRVTVEGMLAGKPVVGTNSGGTSYIIKDEHTGLLYDPGDSNDLASKIIKLIDDPKLSHRIARNAKRHALDEYSQTKCYINFMRYVEKNIKKRRSINLSPLAALSKGYVRAIEAKIHADNELEQYSKQNQILVNKINVLEKTVHDIYASRTWRLVTFIRKILMK